jgi:hypothetical protein
MKNYLPRSVILLLIYMLAFSCSKNNSNPSPQPNPTPTPPDTNLVAYYAFTGSAIDSSMYHHDGIVSNAVLTADRFGASNKAYEFNGTNSYIRLTGSSQLDQNASISIMAWVKPQVICGSGVGCYIVWRGDGQSAHDPYALYFNDNSVGIRKDVESGTTINQTMNPVNNSFANKWSHVAGTYDAANHTGRVYIDGILVKEKVFTTSTVSYKTTDFLTNIGMATIGLTNDPLGGFTGSIDEVRIYKKVLTTAEIVQLSK